MNQSSKTCWIIHTDTSINIASLGLAVHWNYDLFMLEMDIRQWPVRWKNGIFCFLYTIAFLCIFCFHFCTQIKSNVYFVVAIVMGILSPFLVIFLPNTFISFTKLRFRRSFWVAQHIWILSKGLWAGQA